MKIASTTPASSQRINRWLYLAFVSLSVVLFILKDYHSAFANLGIALIADPFDQTVRWKDRPLYQKALLLVHVIVVLAGLLWVFLLKK